MGRMAYKEDRGEWRIGGMKNEGVGVGRGLSAGGEGDG